MVESLSLETNSGLTYSDALQKLRAVAGSEAIPLKQLLAQFPPPYEDLNLLSGCAEGCSFLLLVFFPRLKKVWEGRIDQREELVFDQVLLLAESLSVIIPAAGELVPRQQSPSELSHFDTYVNGFPSKRRSIPPNFWSYILQETEFSEVIECRIYTPYEIHLCIFDKEEPSTGFFFSFHKIDVKRKTVEISLELIKETPGSSRTLSFTNCPLHLLESLLKEIARRVNLGLSEPIPVEELIHAGFLF